MGEKNYLLIIPDSIKYLHSQCGKYGKRPAWCLQPVQPQLLFWKILHICAKLLQHFGRNLCAAAVGNTRQTLQSVHMFISKKVEKRCKTSSTCTTISCGMEPNFVFELKDWLKNLIKVGRTCTCKAPHFITKSNTVDKVVSFISRDQFQQNWFMQMETARCKIRSRCVQSSLCSSLFRDIVDFLNHRRPELASERASERNQCLHYAGRDEQHDWLYIPLMHPIAQPPSHPSAVDRKPAEALCTETSLLHLR